MWPKGMERRALDLEVAGRVRGCDKLRMQRVKVSRAGVLGQQTELFTETASTFT